MHGQTTDAFLMPLEHTGQLPRRGHPNDGLRIGGSRDQKIRVATEGAIPNPFLVA